MCRKRGNSFNFVMEDQSPTWNLSRSMEKSFDRPGRWTMFLNGASGGGGTKAWVHKAEQPPDTEDHALLYRVRWSIHALELKHAALKMKKR